MVSPAFHGPDEHAGGAFSSEMLMNSHIPIAGLAKKNYADSLRRTQANGSFDEHSELIHRPEEEKESITRHPPLPAFG